MPIKDRNAKKKLIKILIRTSSPSGKVWRPFYWLVILYWMNAAVSERTDYSYDWLAQ